MNVGPLLLPTTAFYLLLFVAAFGLALRLTVTAAMLRRQLWDISWFGLVIGLLVARLIFVIRFHDAFNHPLEWFDIRDGGFEVELGVIAGLGYVLIKTLPHKRIFSRLMRASLLTLMVAAPVTVLTYPTPIATELPNLVYEDLQGQGFSLQQLAGKPVVINLWATWCPPCRREMPAFHQAQQDNPEVAFVLINQGEPNAAVSEYLEQLGLDFKIMLTDPFSQAAKHFGAYGTPTTLFYDRDGKLIHKRVGSLSHASLYANLDKIK